VQFFSNGSDLEALLPGLWPMLACVGAAALKSYRQTLD
jgi:hypothetical protein